MTSTSFSVEDLYRVLSDEAEAYRQLVDLTQRERDALQKENLVDISEATRNKELLMEKLVKFEQLRNRIVSGFVQELKLPVGASFLDLIAKFDGAIADKLLTLRQEFINLVELQLALNHGNQLFLQSKLARVNATFDYLASIAVQPDGNYTAKGGPHSQQQATSGHVLNWQI